MEECFVIRSREYDLESSRPSSMMQRTASWYELSRIKGHYLAGPKRLTSYNYWKSRPVCDSWARSQ